MTDPDVLAGIVLAAGSLVWLLAVCCIRLVGGR